MKIKLAVAILGVTISCVGCRPLPVKDYGDLGTGNSAGAATSKLIVRTDTYTSYEDDVPRDVHLPFDVYDINGRMILHAPNRMSFTDPGPDAVRLAPGRYRIRAQTTKGHLAEFTVTVEASKVTEVDLARLAEGQGPAKQ
jgi:hypothetical protein